MADERPNIGGDLKAVRAELAAMRAELEALRAAGTRASTEKPGATARAAKQEARARPKAGEAGAEGTAQNIERENRGLRERRKLLDENTAAQSRTARQSPGEAPRARRTAVGDILRPPEPPKSVAQILGKSPVDPSAARKAAQQGEYAAVAKAQQEAAAKAEELARLEQRTSTIAGTGATQVRQSAAAYQELAQTQAAASTQMRRHGALTTEFLQAAARGESTLSEFRFQIGATIAKFAGWTAAAASVYGVLNVLKLLDKGALDELNAVNAISRSIQDLDKAATGRGLSDLSQKFNLPVGDVGAAVYEFAKNNQGNRGADALEASRAALYAVKVGELEAADAAKYLIAIQQGLGVSAQELVPKFDQVNQAQNKFGVNIQSTLAGLSKSVGAFKAAGGTFDTALAIITTASRTTGRSGEQIGTALQRSASLVRRPKNQQQLRSFGIDPTQDIDAIYLQAIKESRQLSGRRRLELATALSTPQLAPYLVGVLNNPDLFEKVRKTTSPAASKGSAERELQTQLKAAGEQLQRLTNGVQRLGAELAQIGAFTLAGVFLRALNGAVDAVDKLLELANALPGPFKTVAVTVLQLVAALKLIRRTNIASALPAGTPGKGFLQEPILVRGRRDFLRANRTEVDALTRRREDVTNRSLEAAGQREIAALNLAQADNRAVAAKRSGNVDDQIRAQRRLLAAQGTIDALDQELESLAVQDAYLRRRIAERQAQSTVAQRLTNAQLQRQFGDTVIGPKGPPTIADNTTLRQQLGSTVPTGKRVILPPNVEGPLASPAAIAEAELKQETANAARVKQTTAARQKLATAVRQEGALLGTFNTASLALYGGVAKAGEAASKIKAGAGGTLRNAAGTLTRAGGALLASIGPLEAGLIGYFAVQAALEANGKTVDRLNALATRNPTSVNEIKRQADAARNANPFSRTGQQQIQDALNDATVLRAQTKSPITSGRKNFLLLGSTLSSQIKDAQTARQAGNITLAQYDRALATALADVRGAANISAADKKKLAAEIRDARAGLTQGSFANLSTDEIKKLLKSYESIISSDSATGGQRRQGTQNIARLVATLTAKLTTGVPTPADVAEINQELDAAAKAIGESAQAELTIALTFAKGQQERDALYSRARAQVGSSLAGFDKGIQDQRKKISTLEDKATQASLPRSGNANDFKKFTEQAKAEKNVLTNLLKRRASFKQALKAQQKALDDARFQEDQAYRDSVASLQASRSDTALGQIAPQIRRAGQRVAEVIRKYGRNSTEANNAVQQQNELLRQQAQAVLADITAGYDIRIAQTSDPLQAAKLAVDKDKALLGKAKGDERKQILAQYYADLKALDQAKLDRANLEFDLAASRTDDPNRLADIAVKRARFALKNAKDPSSRATAQAQLNTSLRDKASTYVQQRESDLDFQVEIGKITVQQEIAGLERLLKVHNLGKQARKELKQKIERLKHQTQSQDVSSYNLTVGDIRLPTVYEVRRAAQGGARQISGRGAVVVNNSPTINVTIANKGDVAAFATAAEDVLGAGVRSGLRAQGALG